MNDFKILDLRWNLAIPEVPKMPVKANFSSFNISYLLHYFSDKTTFSTSRSNSRESQFLHKSSRLVLFDWNGTFVDDEAETVEGLRAILQAIGDPRSNLDQPTLTELHQQTFTIPLVDMWDKLGFDQRQIELVRSGLFWKDKYESLESEIKMQPGIAESLRVLDGLSVSVGILSNHTVSGIQRLLDRFGYGDMDILANNNDRQAHNRGKSHRLKTYLENNPNTEIIAIVGDSEEEIAIARDARTTSIALTNGWVPAGRLAQHQPDFLIHSSQLPEIIGQIVRSR